MKLKKPAKVKLAAEYRITSYILSDMGGHDVRIQVSKPFNFDNKQPWPSSNKLDQASLIHNQLERPYSKMYHEVQCLVLTP